MADNVPGGLLRSRPRQCSTPSLGSPGPVCHDGDHQQPPERPSRGGITLVVGTHALGLGRSRAPR